MKIEGKILDDRNDPVPGATIQIRMGETRLANVTSSTDGSFEFSTSGSLGGDSITLAVTKQGYKSTEVTKGVASGGLDAWTVNLTKVQSVSPDVPPPPPPTKVPWIKIGLAAVILIIIGGIVAYVVNSPDQDPVQPEERLTVTVDRVIGMDLASAKSTLTEAGLVPEEGGTIVTGSVEPGQVASQDPAPGEELPQGGVVALIVEETSVDVPNLLGMDLRSATRNLTDLGLELEEQGKAITGNFAVGRVAIQLPEAGSSVPPGTTVTVIVEDQPQRNTVNVPNLIGKTEREAIALLKNLELVPAKARGTRITRKVKTGQVAMQAPESGQKVTPGSRVTYYLARASITPGGLDLELDRSIFIPNQTFRLAHTITITSLSPRSPSRIPLNRRVNIQFKYSTTERGGVRIFILPMSGSSPTPGYAVSGSPSYRTGSGTGKAYFMIRQGSGSIDRLRIQMWTADQKKMLRQIYHPVQYRYSK